MIVLIYFVSFFILHKADIIPFKNHVVSPLQPEYWTLYKFQPSDAPHWSPGLGRSYIDLSGLKFQTSCQSSSSCSDTKLDVLMFEEPNEHWLDYWDNGQFCCNQDLINSGACTTLGTLIYPTTFPNSAITRLKIKAKSNQVTQISSEVRTCS